MFVGLTHNRKCDPDGAWSASRPDKCPVKATKWRVFASLTSFSLRGERVKSSSSFSGRLLRRLFTAETESGPKSVIIELFLCWPPASERVDVGGVGRCKSTKLEVECFRRNQIKTKPSNDQNRSTRCWTTAVRFLWLLSANKTWSLTEAVYRFCSTSIRSVRWNEEYSDWKLLVFGWEKVVLLVKGGIEKKSASLAFCKMTRITVTVAGILLLCSLAVASHSSSVYVDKSAYKNIVIEIRDSVPVENCQSTLHNLEVSLFLKLVYCIAYTKNTFW